MKHLGIIFLYHSIEDHLIGSQTTKTLTNLYKYVYYAISFPRNIKAYIIQ